MLGIRVARISYDARLGPFTFSRGHSYYWIAEGPMPLLVAREIYKDPLGKKDVRAGGHWGRLPPDENVIWLTQDGKQVHPCKQPDGQWTKAVWERLIEKGLLTSEYYDNATFSDSPSAIAAGYVATYHIDSMLGLKLYVDTIREHGLDKLPEPVGWDRRL